jgi:hypothetical protein
MTDRLEPMVARLDQQQVAQGLVDRARHEGWNSSGRAVKISEHLGHEKHEAAGRNGENPAMTPGPRPSGPRSGGHDRRATGSGRHVRTGIVREHRRRLDGIDNLVLSLTARGLTTGEIGALTGRGLCRLGQ